LADGQQADFAPLTPMQLSHAMKATKTRNRIEQIKTIILGGGEIAPQLELDIQQLNTRIYATYGMTETVSHIALRAINGPEASKAFTALPGVTFAANQDDCLVINAPHLGIAALATNDVAELLSPTSFIWKARYDNVVNSGGIKLYPEEIERKLMDHVSLSFFLTGEKDAVYGERLVIVIEGNIEAAELRAIFTTVLSKYEKPQAIYLSTGFTRTESGKIQRRESLNDATLLSYL
jgi:O-succinylbenzoic acid--CoA ligase